MLRKRYRIESLEVQKNFKLFKLPNSEAVILDFLLKIKLILFYEKYFNNKRLNGSIPERSQDVELVSEHPD